MTFRVGQDTDGLRYELGKMSARVQLRDGTSVQLRADNLSAGIAERGLPSATVMPGIKWDSVKSSNASTSRHTFGLPMTASQRRAIAGNGKTITLDGRMIVRERRVRTTMPLREGGELRQQGIIRQIVRWAPEHEEPSLIIATNQLGSSSSESWQDEAAIVNAVRREGVMLTRRSGSMGVDALVLPGALRSEGRATYRTIDGRAVGWLRDSAWTRDARVVLFEIVPVGNYPVRLSLALPQ